MEGLNFGYNDYCLDKNSEDALVASLLEDFEAEKDCEPEEIQDDTVGLNKTKISDLQKRFHASKLRSMELALASASKSEREAEGAEIVIVTKGYERKLAERNKIISELYSKEH